MSLGTFKASKAGHRIASLLSDPSILARMKELSNVGTPAVGALDNALAGQVHLNDTERQYVGRWIREVLADHGWRKGPQRRLKGGRLFSSGCIYQPAHVGQSRASVAIPQNLLPAATRISRARELVAAATTREYSIDDYLRDKYAEAAIENTA